MRVGLIISLLLLGCIAKAQFVTNAYWTQDSDQTGNNIIYYNFAKPLSWSDFRGAPGPEGPVAAITTSGFGYKAKMNSSGGKGEVNVGVYCFFSKDKSWVKPTRNTPYILNHEQHHFDVSFLAANIFMEKVRTSNLTFANCNILLPKLYRECCDIMNKMQNDYDGQTMNGRVEDMQQKWNNFFIDRLSKIIN